MLNGIDISNNNYTLDLKTVLEKNPIDFVIMKATQGNWYVDAYCDTFYQTAKSMDKLLGVYHYADGTGTPEEEARFFIENVKGYVHEAILIMDWEHYSNVAFYTADWCEKFVDEVYKLTGVYPVIYMNENTLHKKDARLFDFDWKALLDKNCGLWLAQYADNNPTGFQDKPWSTVSDYYVLIHQYTSHGELLGYNLELDLDIAYLTADAWKLYANPSGKQVSNVKVDKPVKAIKVGDTVTTSSLIDYNGFENDRWVLGQHFKVMEVKGDRVVIGRSGSITGAWHVGNLRKV